MNFRWLKPYMPGSLYGRAILILLLPVASLLLVITIVFIQRHFEGVTRQMTQAVSREVTLVLDTAPLPERARGRRWPRCCRLPLAGYRASRCRGKTPGAGSILPVPS